VFRAWLDELGIGGAYPDTSLIQAGVNEAYDPSTNLEYLYAWWEVLPAPATPIFTVPVLPGNDITVTIAQVSPGVWTIVLTNDTTGQSFSTEQSYSGAGDSAEWIVEAPTQLSTQSVLTLGDYTPNVTFSSLGFTGTQSAVTDVVMVQNGVAVSTPSALTANGFTVAYGSVVPSPP
jgi:hypothetical protein